MRREIQVHFENCGQIAWHEDIDDVEAWIDEVLSEEKITAYDQETKRYFAFLTKTVTAYVISEKSEEKDLWSRTYATKEGNVEKDDKQKYPGNGPQRISTETGRSSCY